MNVMWCGVGSWLLCNSDHSGHVRSVWPDHLPVGRRSYVNPTDMVNVVASRTRGPCIEPFTCVLVLRTTTQSKLRRNLGQFFFAYFGDCLINANDLRCFCVAAGVLMTLHSGCAAAAICCCPAATLWLLGSGSAYCAAGSIMAAIWRRKKTPIRQRQPASGGQLCLLIPSVCLFLRLQLAANWVYATTLYLHGEPEKCATLFSTLAVAFLKATFMIFVPV